MALVSDESIVCETSPEVLMTANATPHVKFNGRTPRRQLRHVELQDIDATRIINSLGGRSARTWPSTRTTSHV